MGEHHEAKFAWMIPVMDGKIPESDPAEPTTALIFKIPVERVGEFQAKHNVAGAFWHPLYSVIDATKNFPSLGI